MNQWWNAHLFDLYYFFLIRHQWVQVLSIKTLCQFIYCCDNELIFFASRDFFLAAVFQWIILFLLAVSIDFTKFLYKWCIVSRFIFSSVSMALIVFFDAVRIEDLTWLFLICLFSFCLILFFVDFVFANSSPFFIYFYDPTIIYWFTFVNNKRKTYIIKYDLCRYAVKGQWPVRCFWLKSWSYRLGVLFLIKNKNFFGNWNSDTMKLNDSNSKKWKTLVYELILESF